MTSSKVAFLSIHTCPLAAPGQGKSGGMNVHVRQLAAALGDMGVEVDIFTRTHSGHSEEIESLGHNVRVIHLNAGDFDVPLENLFEYLPEFLYELKKYNNEYSIGYHAVHSHYWMSGWVGQQIADDLNIPHLITFHTLARIKMQSRPGEQESHRRQDTEQEVMANADKIIAFSPHERDAMIRLYNAPCDRIELVPCGVDLTRFKPIDRSHARKYLGINGEKVFLYVGRIESLKGVDLLLETAAHLDGSQDIRVLVVGGDEGRGQAVSRLKQRAKDLYIDGIVDFVGRVDQDQLPIYYNAADVCVVPSFYESFGLAALESMACGTPVVAYRVGGLPTIIKHGRTGYLKSWRCPEAFANSLEMMTSSNSLIKAMGQASRERAETMGWDRVAFTLSEHYKSLAKEMA